MTQMTTAKNLALTILKSQELDEAAELLRQSRRFVDEDTSTEASVYLERVAMLLLRIDRGR